MPRQARRPEKNDVTSRARAQHRMDAVSLPGHGAVMPSHPDAPQTDARSLRICVVTHTFPRFPGDPTAPFLAVLVDAWARLGHQVLVLAPDDRQWRKPAGGAVAVRTYRYAVPRRLQQLGYSRSLDAGSRPTALTRWLAPAFMVAGTAALWRTVGEFRPDVVSAHWMFPGGLQAAAAHMLRPFPLVLTVPGSDVHLAAQGPVLRAMAATAVHRAHTLVADHGAYLDALHALGLSHPREEVIPYGVDLQAFQPGSRDPAVWREHGVPDGAPVVLAVGRLVEKKGFVHAVRALPHLRARFPSVRLVLVGDGDQRDALEQVARQLGVRDAVVFAGMVEHHALARYYAGAHVLVAPSRRDAHGNMDASPVAVMEALACGLPVVGTPLAAVAGLLEGGGGSVVSGEEPEQLAHALAAVLADTNTTARREAARAQAQAHCSVVRTAQRYLDVFSRACVQPRGHGGPP